MCCYKGLFLAFTSLLLLSFLQTINEDAYEFLEQLPENNLKNEVQSLVTIYLSTNGEGWKDSKNWLSSQKISDWKGVDIQDGHIASLCLPNNSLTGMLPDNAFDELQVNDF